MPVQNKPRRAPSTALAHLDWLLDQALDQTFSTIEGAILPSANAMLDELEWWTDVTMKGRNAAEAIGRPSPFL
jgi:hypothetical protein